MDKKNILNAVNVYYTNKIKKHGVSAEGVDWNSEQSQELRFKQLLKLSEMKGDFSVLDYGCGYGALLDYMNKRTDFNFKYLGYDISKDMLKEAKNIFGENDEIRWINDYSIRFIYN